MQGAREFIPHPGQKAVLTSKKRFLVAMGGKRGGKTTVACYWSAIQANSPNTIGLIGANTYDQLNQSTLSKFFEIFPDLRDFYVKRDRQINLPNGSKILVRSMEDAYKLEGLNLHWIWIDEADALAEHVWNILRGRVASTMGRILLTSTIYPNSWIYDQFITKNDDDYGIITWESNANPSFPAEEFEKLKKEIDPITFQREYQSKFVFHAGKVYGDILDYGVVGEFQNKSKPLKLFFGIDYGVKDPTVIQVMTYNSDGAWYIIDEYHATDRMSVQEINTWCHAFKNKYEMVYDVKLAYTVNDPAGGVARMSIETVFNPIDAVKKISERITLINNLIYQRKLYVFKKCIYTLEEFAKYMFDPRSKGEIPMDKWNHHMDAMAYVIHTCHPMVEHLAESGEVEEALSPFWQAKMDKGVYKGGGQLAGKRSLDEFMGGDVYY